MTDAPFTFEGCDSPAACRDGTRYAAQACKGRLVSVDALLTKAEADARRAR